MTVGCTTDECVNTAYERGALHGPVPPGPAGSPTQIDGSAVLRWAYDRGMRERLWLVCVAAAVGWGVVLLAGAWLAPVYRGVSVSVACPGCPPVQTTEMRTLVEVNGPAVLVPVAVPLLAALTVGTLLLLRGATGSSRASLAAWLLIVVLGVFTFLAMFSIGTYVLPSVALLAFAALLAPRGPRGVGAEGVRG